LRRRPAHPLHLVLGDTFGQPVAHNRLRLISFLASGEVKGAGRCALGRRTCAFGAAGAALAFFAAAAALAVAPGCGPRLPMMIYQQKAVLPLVPALPKGFCRAEYRTKSSNADSPTVMRTVGR
jgi:hypothetical protein